MIVLGYKKKKKRRMKKKQLNTSKRRRGRVRDRERGKKDKKSNFNSSSYSNNKVWGVRGEKKAQLDLECMSNIIPSQYQCLQCSVVHVSITGWTHSKQNQLWLTVTHQRVKELRFGVCHVTAKWILGSSARCLFGRLARAMSTNVIFQIFKVNINL